jgi:hypothetical protein
MRLLKSGLVHLLLVGAFSLISISPALGALPDVHILSGEEYGTGVTGEGTLENAGAIVAELETGLGEKLTATAVTAKATLKELSALGPDTLTFKGVTEPRTKTRCLTTSNTKVEGEVIVPGEYHVVDAYGQPGEESPSVHAFLFLFGELTIECNSKKLKVKVRAPVLVQLAKVTSGTDVEQYGLVARCGAGLQLLKEYLNDEGKAIHGELAANFGLGLELACYRTSKELLLKSTRMIDFLF